MVPGSISALHRCQNGNGWKVIISLHSKLILDKKKLNPWFGKTNKQTEFALQNRFGIPVSFSVQNPPCKQPILGELQYILCFMKQKVNNVANYPWTTMK